MVYLRGKIKGYRLSVKRVVVLRSMDVIVRGSMLEEIFDLEIQGIVG